jgi:hydroxymethylpyrimidine/phosphomethylpyrimidine kinase
VIARPAVLAVGAVTPSAFDGIVGDAAVLDELDCRAVPIVTSLLGQAPGRRYAEPLAGELLERQFAAALAGPRPEGAKIGVILDPQQVKIVADAIAGAVPDVAVYAPVVALRGETLLDGRTLEAARRELFLRARVVVLRATDAERLLGVAVDGFEDLRAAAEETLRQGARAVIVAGLQLHGRVADVVAEGGAMRLLDAPRLLAGHIAGVAGAYATAVAGHLARGADPFRAAESAQRYIAMRLMRGR